MITHNLKNDILYVHLSGIVDSIEMQKSFRYRLEHYGSGISTIVTFDENLVFAPVKKHFEEQFKRMKLLIEKSRPRWMIFYVFHNRPEIHNFIDSFLAIFDTEGSSFWKTETVEKAESLIRGLRKIREEEPEQIIPRSRASV